MRRELYLSQISLKLLKNILLPGITPPSPCIGSTKTPEIF